MERASGANDAPRDQNGNSIRLDLQSISIAIADAFFAHRARLRFGAVMTQPFRVAAVQMCAGGDKTANLDVAIDLVRQAAAEGARLVVLPEVFLWRGPQDAERGNAETIPGPSTDQLAALARSLEIYIVAGSILESTEDRVFNTCVLFAPNGEIRARYRKLHLFDVDVPPDVRIRESDSRKPGDEIVAVETELGVVGLSICYDLRFPELYRGLSTRGATILCVPAAFTFTTGSAHWEVLLRARAIENQAYVIAANQFGSGIGGILNYGHSLIVDPWGTVIAGTGSDRAGVLTATVDPTLVARVRAQLPALTHRRIGDGEI